MSINMSRFRNAAVAGMAVLSMGTAGAGRALAKEAAVVAKTGAESAEKVKLSYDAFSRVGTDTDLKTHLRSSVRLTLKGSENLSSDAVKSVDYTSKAEVIDVVPNLSFVRDPRWDRLELKNEVRLNFPKFNLTTNSEGKPCLTLQLYVDLKNRLRNTLTAETKHLL